MQVDHVILINILQIIGNILTSCGKRLGTTSESWTLASDIGLKRLDNYIALQKLLDNLKR